MRPVCSAMGVASIRVATRLFVGLEEELWKPKPRL